MAIIDKGEKHLFIRRLLDSSGDPILWEDINDVTFDLLLLGEKLKQSWSKAGGGVTKSDGSVQFEFDSGDADKGKYYLRATLNVNDARWDSGTSDDITWEDDPIEIIETKTPSNSSSTTGDLQFDVIVEDGVEKPSNPPFSGPFNITHSRPTTCRIFWTGVDDATFYEVQIESTGNITDYGDVTQATLTGLTPNTTDRWRVRSGNSAGVSDEWSQWQSFTTNPVTLPELVGNVSTTPNSASYTIANPDGLEVEYVKDNLWVNVGVVTDITITGLAENTDFNVDHRFRNAGGVSRNLDGDLIRSTISFSTTQSAPSTPPTLSVQEENDDGATFTRTSVAGASDYEIEIDDSDTWESIGLVSPFTYSGQNGNTNHSAKLRAINSGGNGPESAAVSYLTLPDDAPDLINSAKSSTTLTVNVGAVGGTGALTYKVDPGTGTFQTVTQGENEFTGLDPLTSYNFRSQVSNASGDGPIKTFTFTTDPEVVEPVYDEASFLNGFNNTDGFFIEVRRTGAGGPNYEIRIRESGGSFSSAVSMPNLTYRFTDLLNGTEYDVEIRSTDGTSSSAWVRISVQTDAYTESEQSGVNQFTTTA